MARFPLKILFTKISRNCPHRNQHYFIQYNNRVVKNVSNFVKGYFQERNFNNKLKHVVESSTYLNDINDL